MKTKVALGLVWRASPALMTLLVLQLPACVATAGFGSANHAQSETPTSSSSDTVTIPNVFGMTRTQAEAALTHAGVTGSIDYNDSLCGSIVDGKIIELGQVCYQRPAPGPHNPRLSVTLRVQTEDPRHGNIGKNNEWHLMPSLVGFSLERAREAMRSAGFSTKDHVEVMRVQEAGCMPYIVCRTRPEANDRAGQSSSKTIFVGALPEAPLPPATDRNASSEPTKTQSPEPKKPTESESKREPKPEPLF
jgi:beta-lactam-binding protein with PASTA domain